MPIYKTYKCLECEKVVRKPNSVGKYCSNKCQQKYQTYEKIRNKTAGPRALKTYLIETTEYKCCECGISEYNNKPIVLELEHKDGNSENNELDNLALICPNCHSQTSTYKNRNKGNGRYARRQRYQQNLSY